MVPVDVEVEPVVVGVVVDVVVVHMSRSCSPPVVNEWVDVVSSKHF